MNHRSLRHSPLHFIFLALTLALLSACTTTSTPKTFNDQAAVGYATVTAVYETTALAVRAGKIGKKDAENVLKQADDARDAIDIAKTLHAAQDASADSKLSAAISTLAVLQTYLQRIQ